MIMAAKIKLDKFQLMWLFEGAAGKSHLRWDIYQMFIDDIYPQLDDNEREFLYIYIKRDTSWMWENRGKADETPYNYWLQVLARYNPSNQFIVTAEYNGEKETKDAYLWDGKYYVGYNNYFANEYIVNVEQKPYKKCLNELCGKHQQCKRYTTHKFGDEVIDELKSYYCNKCDMLIEDDETD